MLNKGIRYFKIFVPKTINILIKRQPHAALELVKNIHVEKPKKIDNIVVFFKKLFAPNIAAIVKGQTMLSHAPV